MLVGGVTWILNFVLVIAMTTIQKNEIIYATRRIMTNGSIEKVRIGFT